MILWIVLFILVLAISFILALKSMKDFQEIPSQSGQNYSLFLIRNNEGVNQQFFNLLYADLLESNSSVSFERLFKGKKSALVVYGPSNLLNKYKQTLNLLELEDYTNVNIDKTSAWEMGIKKIEARILQNLPELSETDQFWWQVVTWIKKDKADSFQTQIRAVVYTNDQARNKDLTQTLQNLSIDQLVKTPKAFSNPQLMDFYKKRSFSKLGKNPVLKWEQIHQLIALF